MERIYSNNGVPHMHCSRNTCWKPHSTNNIIGGRRERERDRASYRGGCDKTRYNRLGVRLDSACEVERAKIGERRGGRKMVLHVVTGANDTKEGREHTCRTARHVTGGIWCDYRC